MSLARGTIAGRLGVLPVCRGLWQPVLVQQSLLHVYDLFDSCAPVNSMVRCKEASG